MLKRMIDALPDTIRHGELYGVNRALGPSSNSQTRMSPEALFALRTTIEPAFLREIDFIPECRTGLKILYDQLFTLGAASLLNMLTNNKRIRIIHLWRRDLEARHYSMRRLKYQNQHKGKGKVVIDHTCDAHILFNEATRLIHQGNFVSNHFSGHPVLNVCYEDILNNAQTRAGLLDFLGIDKTCIASFEPPEEIRPPKNTDITVNLLGRDEASRAYQAMADDLPTIQFL